MMKVIVSHDIDHISVTEHLFKDLIIPKHIVRSQLEWLNGKISFQEVIFRFQDLFKNKFNNVKELIEYNNAKEVNGTFFIGVENGIGLSYSLLQAQSIFKIISDANYSVQLHGMNFQSQEVINQEKMKFEHVFNLPAQGIRMHYVRKDNTTLNKFSNAGYLYDSTLFDFKNPFKVGEMWEFPFQIMDGWIIENGKKRQSRNLNESIEETKKIINKCIDLKLSHIVIDFHDHYFCKSFKTWMDWYCWLIEYLKQNKFTFTDFNSEVNELNSIHKPEFAKQFFS
jgi:hypothetical protein